MLLSGLWHFNPSIPEFTCCEDCFETLIYPEIQKRHPLALKFNQTLQPHYGETVGSSCQLYSLRMRRVWERALKGNDMVYLARKARERREAELRLQRSFAVLRAKGKRLSWVSASEEAERVDWEIYRVKMEWTENWE